MMATKTTSIIRLVHNWDQTRFKCTHAEYAGWVRIKISQLIQNRFITAASISNKILFLSMVQLTTIWCSKKSLRPHLFVSVDLLKRILTIGMHPYMQWDSVETVELSSKYWRIIIKITITSLEWEKSLALGFLMQIITGKFFEKRGVMWISNQIYFMMTKLN